MTRTSWSEYVEWTNADKKAKQNTIDRLNILLEMLLFGIQRQLEMTNILLFKFYTIPRTGKCKTPQLITLKCKSIDGNHGQAKLIIMLPEED